MSDHWSTELSTTKPHCSENPIYVFPEKELRGHSPYLHIHACVCEQFIYS